MLFRNNKLTVHDPVTGKDVEFEIRNSIGIIEYRDPAIKDPKSPAAWVMHAPFPREPDIDYGVLDTRSILQRFFGLPGLTVHEQSYIVAEELEGKITDEDWAVIPNLQKRDDTKRGLKALVNERVQRTVEADRQLSDTRAAQKFADNLNIYTKTRLPCGHPVIKHGATMFNFERMVRLNPDLKELRCQVCGAPVPIDVFKKIHAEI